MHRHGPLRRLLILRSFGTVEAQDLCSAHHQRWASHGKPDLGEFKAGAAAVAVRAGSENMDGFDLSALAVDPHVTHRDAVSFLLGSSTASHATEERDKRRGTPPGLHSASRP